MKLTKAAILTLRGMNHQAKEKVAAAAGVSMPTLYRWINENNDGLTKAAALQVIREETGLSDQEILEEEKEKEVA